MNLTDEEIIEAMADAYKRGAMRSAYVIAKPLIEEKLLLEFWKIGRRCDSIVTEEAKRDMQKLARAVAKILDEHAIELEAQLTPEQKASILSTRR